MISREHAKEVLENLVNNEVLKSVLLRTDIEAMKCAISALSENTGEWIDNGSATYTCSNCKTKWTTSQIEKMCFCPTCGADMRELKGEKGTE